MTPDLLLAGPRGRRLCLELVQPPADGFTADDNELRHALFYAAHHADPGAGTSRVVFGWGVPDPLPEPSSADVARLIEDRPLPEPGAEQVWRALGATVDSARYWQEPDGEDGLAATPEVTGALPQVARVVTTSAHTVWWTAPLRRTDQWAVTFLEPEDRGPDPWAGLPAGRQLARWTERERALEEEFRREQPGDAREPISAHWWSVPVAGLVSTTSRIPGRGPVGLRMVEDELGWDRATVRRVEVPADARVYEVDGPEAWTELCRRHPLDVSASRRYDWFRATGEDLPWVIPDWQRVAEDVDAVHLTVAGYLTTAGRALPLGDGRSTVLAGWDPDATLWLTDLPGAGGAEETWVRDEDGDWAPKHPR